MIRRVSPPSDILPCTGDWAGRFLQDFCEDCHHALAVHRHDQVCSVCDAIATMRIDIQHLKERLDALG